VPVDHSWRREISIQPSVEAENERQAFGLLIDACTTLERKLLDLGLGGLSSYVKDVASGIKSDSQQPSSESLSNSLKRTDKMYATLREHKNNISVSPQIKSLPQNAVIEIQSRAQAAKNEYEFVGTTDTRGVDLYRGIYSFKLILPDGTFTQGEFNLIEYPGNLIVCTKRTDSTSFTCEIS
jgi:hypothetical protein